MVPMTRALGTSAATIRTAPFLLVGLDAHEGVVGRGYQFSGPEGHGSSDRVAGSGVRGGVAV